MNQYTWFTVFQRRDGIYGVNYH